MFMAATSAKKSLDMTFRSYKGGDDSVDFIKKLYEDALKDQTPINLIFVWWSYQLYKRSNGKSNKPIKVVVNFGDIAINFTLSLGDDPDITGQQVDNNIDINLPMHDIDSDDQLKDLFKNKRFLGKVARSFRSTTCHEVRHVFQTYNPEDNASKRLYRSNDREYYALPTPPDFLYDIYAFNEWELEAYYEAACNMLDELKEKGKTGLNRLIMFVNVMRCRLSTDFRYRRFKNGDFTGVTTNDDPVNPVEEILMVNAIINWLPQYDSGITELPQWRKFYDLYKDRLQEFTKKNNYIDDIVDLINGQEVPTILRVKFFSRMVKLLGTPKWTKDYSVLEKFVEMDTLADVYSLVYHIMKTLNNSQSK